MKDNDLTDFTVDGVCSCCGECCSNYLPLTVFEFNRLKSWVRRTKFKPEFIYDVLDITCPFLDKELSRCVCYDIRPEICKIFTCHKAKLSKVKLSKPLDKYRTYNLRADIFGDKRVIPYGEFKILMDYLKDNPHNS